MTMSFARRLSAGVAVLGICLLVSASVVHGAVVPVSTTAQLQSAILNASPGDEIVVAAGTYTPTAYLTINDNNVTVRGATGNPADVVIQGMGMNVNTSVKEGFALYADNITIRDLTVQEYFYHAIHFQPGADGMQIINVVTRNNGQQHIKGAKYNYDGLIEYTVCEQTYVRTNLPSDPRGVDYVGGIDLHGGINFVIRNCVVRNIMGAGGDADGSIFAWNQSGNWTVERCLVIGGNRGICLGNNSGGSAGYDVDGAIIRNNVVYARTAFNPPADQPWLGNADVAMDVFATRNAKIYNNTLWTDSGSYGRTIRVGRAGSYNNSNVQFRDNIIRGNFQVFTGSNYTSVGDLVGNVAQPSWFVAPAAENFRLTRLATGALDSATLWPEVPADFDGQARPAGAAPDKGADERLPGDVDNDGYVNIFDVFVIAEHWNSQQGDPNYSADADADADGSINIFDIFVVAEDWNK